MVWHGCVWFELYCIQCYGLDCIVYIQWYGLVCIVYIDMVWSVLNTMVWFGLHYIQRYGLFCTVYNGMVWTVFVLALLQVCRCSAFFQPNNQNQRRDRNGARKREIQEGRKVLGRRKEGLGRRFKEFKDGNYKRSEEI